MNVLLDPVCSRAAIFPDEVDSNNEDNEGDPKDLKKPLCSKKVSSARNWRELALEAWKQNSDLFKKCKFIECDPLHLFCGRFICKKCKKQRTKAFSKVLFLEKNFCLIWPKNALFDIVLDYVYFHAILIFDPRAVVRFTQENPSHPYLRNYKDLRQFNGNLTEGISDMFQFPHQMKMAVRQHSQLSTVTEVQLSCEICDDNNSSSLCKIYILSGRRYITDTMKMVRCLKGEPSEQIQLILSERGSGLTAEELIDNIEPLIFKNLTFFFIKCYGRLDSIIDNVSSALFVKEWKGLVHKWKCRIVYQSKS